MDVASERHPLAVGRELDEIPVIDLLLDIQNQAHLGFADDRAVHRWFEPDIGRFDFDDDLQFRAVGESAEGADRQKQNGRFKDW